MKTTTKILAHCLVIASSLASASPIELVIYGASDSAAPIVVETMQTDNLELPFKWTFNAPTAGWPHRTTLLIKIDDQQLTTNDSLAAYLDLDGSVSYTPGEPFGVSSMREHPAIELTDMSAITPRVNLWSGDCDRTTRTGTDWLNIGSSLYDRYEKTTATVPKNRVRIVRYSVDKLPVYKVGVDAGVVLEKDFEETSRDFLHEGDFLVDGDLDIDWKNLYSDVVDWSGAQAAACEVTNVTYLIVYNWDKSEYVSDKDTNTQVKANATLVTRRFEVTRTIPTPVSAYIHSTTTTTNYNFKFRIDNEDKWASWFGTTYTAFKVNVYDATSNIVWNSGILRLPPSDHNGVYMFQTSQTFQNPEILTWRVAVYNAKFKTDTLMKMETEGDPFSAAQPISSEPPLQPDDTSGLVEIPIFLGRYRRLTGDVRVVDQETLKPLHVIPISSMRSDRIVARFHTADTNAAIAAYLDLDGSVSYTPGEPFGVSVPSASSPTGDGTFPSIELTDMSSITPRVNLWSGDCDRTTRTGTDWLNIGSSLYDRYEKTTATVPKNRVRIVRYSVDKFPVYKIGVDADVVLEKDFEKTSRDFIHEGDFLVDGDFDIDWKNLYTDVVDWQGAQLAACEVTNVTYLIVYNWDKSEYVSDKDANTQVRANATLVTRRFEKTRSVPTPVLASSRESSTTFSFRIDNEDKWASWFGTTYTAFKVKVLDGSTEVWNSGIRRLPARDKNGVYRFQTSQTFQNPETLTWRVAVYNSKFKTDTLMKMETEGDPFSPAQPITSTGD